MTEAALSERLPTVDETASAREAVAAMGKALTQMGSLPFKLNEDESEIRLELPPAIGQALLELLGHIARGEMVTVVPYGTVLTTQQAADLLNVSRPYLTKLLEANEIDHHKVGSHRRIKAKDLLDYKDQRDSNRTSVLKKLQRLGQEIEIE